MFAVKWYIEVRRLFPVKDPSRRPAQPFRRCPGGLVTLEEAGMCVVKFTGGVNPSRAQAATRLYRAELRPKKSPGPKNPCLIIPPGYTD